VFAQCSGSDARHATASVRVRIDAGPFFGFSAIRPEAKMV